MVLRSIRETMAVLRESRDAIREGRIAIYEAKLELEARYTRRQRQVEDIERAIELLQTDGPDTDLQRLFTTLDFDGGDGRDTIGRRTDHPSQPMPSARSTKSVVSHRDLSDWTTIFLGSGEMFEHIEKQVLE